MEMLTDLDNYLFHEGTHYEIYKKLGAHLGQKNDEIGFVLNNYYIRHGNETNKQNVNELSDEDMNSLYDKLYRDILYYLLEQEHEDFKDLVKKLKKTFK